MHVVFIFKKITELKDKRNSFKLNDLCLEKWHIIGYQSNENAVKVKVYFIGFVLWLLEKENRKWVFVVSWDVEECVFALKIAPNFIFQSNSLCIF